MTDRSPDEEIAALEPLLDPVRRSLYLYVVGADHEVGRDEAAKAAGISRSLAAFHLDRLVADGLLEASYRRLSGRSGPGAGRPAKIYRPSGATLHVTLPPRDYELAARMLLEGAGRGGGDVRRGRLAARRIGRELGREGRRRAGRRRSRESLGRALMDVLSARGFRPAVEEGGVIRLRNCPFDALAGDYRDQVCGLNLALLEGAIEGVGTPHLVAVADERHPGCCVAFRPADRG